MPQGTLSSPELFIHMLSDFKTVATDVKFVDNSTLADTGNNNTKSDRMQEAANEVARWSEGNHLGINETTTKEIIVWFGNNNDIPPLELYGKEIECVLQSTLLGIIISDDLGWDAHLHHINSKANKRIYIYLRELKRSGLLQSDLIRIVLALIRSVCEYGCHVWSTGLTKGQNNTLESIRKRAFKIVLPKQPHLEAWEALQIPKLKDKCESLCNKKISLKRNLSRFISF